MVTKEEVFEDKSTGGGKVKRALNAEVWQLYGEEGITNMSKIARILKITPKTATKHVKVYGNLALKERQRKRGW